MRVSKGLSHSVEVSTNVILQSMALKQGLHLRGELDELVLRHGGEEVVLDLEVQTADVPAKKAIRAGEVPGGLDLVDCPLLVEARARRG